MTRRTPSGSVSARLAKSLGLKSTSGRIKAAVIASNAIIVAVLGFYFLQQNLYAEASSATAVAINREASNPLDQLSSADIAVHAARLTNLDELRAVTERADTINTQLSMSPSNDVQIVAKPQLVSSDVRSRKDIQKYVSQAGDTVASIAARYNVTSDSIRWSNNIVGDILPAGKEIAIPPRNGIIYLVKDGDTVESLAEKYKSNREQLIAFNDAEVAGLKPGEYILIPDGVMPQPARPTYAASYSGVASIQGFTASYGGNGYDYGYCTWYVANKRAGDGKPIPSNLGHASTWKIRAQAAGYSIGSVPVAGAIAWKVPHDYYGHVAYVESVNDDGTFVISEMNVVGWNRISTQVVTPAQLGSYSFIY